jgi:hypothetical protein
MPQDVFRIDSSKAGRVEEAVNDAMREGESDRLDASLAEHHQVVIGEGATPFDRELAMRLVAVAVEQLPSTLNDDQKNRLDSWLAPRVHYLLRFSRSVAADDGVWRWLATDVFAPYMRIRWPERAKSGWWRYNSPNVLRNGVARLWWAAELVRSGPDYRLVPRALHSVRTFHNVSELRYSMHRETARAFTRVVTERSDVGDRLSKAFNAYLATHGLERFDGVAEEHQYTAWDSGWAGADPDPAQLFGDLDALQGPAVGLARLDVEEQLYEWLSELAQSAGI